MAYEFITKYDSPNYGYPQYTKGQNAPKMIIIHHWGNDGQKFENVINWLCSVRSEAGAHFVVEESRAACLIDYNNAAWGAGNRAANMESIQIECRPECSAGDFQTVAEVIADIFKVYGRKLPLYGHKDFMATACPGRWYARLAELYKKACQIYDGSAPAPAPKKGLEVDGVAGPKTINALQKLLGTVQDGVISGQNSYYKSYWPNITAVTYGGGGSRCVAHLQRYLSNQGFPIYDDGLLGPLTIKALQRFMNKWWGAHLAVDGIAGYNTIWYLQRYLNYKVYGIG